MKKLFMFFTIAILALKLSAQPQSGRVLLSGNFSFTNLKTKEKDNPDYGANKNTLILLPRIGFSSTERFEIGAYGGINFSKTIYNSSTLDLVTKGYIIGLYLRHYLIVKKSGVFLQESIDYSHSKSTANGENEDRVNIFSIGISPGVYFYLTEHLSLETKIGWLGFTSQRTIPYDYLGVQHPTRINNSTAIQLNTQTILFGLTITL